MQFFAYIADPFSQHLLHKHMDIFTLQVDLQLAAVQIVQNALQTVNQGFRVLLGDDAFASQHCRVGHGTGDIFFIHFAVKADGRIEIIRNAVGNAGGDTGPHFCHKEKLLNLTSCR